MDIKPAEVFPLGHFIREELAARGQTVEGMCRGTAMPECRVRELLDDPDARLSMREAEWLGCAMGVSPALLLNLQLLWLKRHP